MGGVCDWRICRVLVGRFQLQCSLLSRCRFVSHDVLLSVVVVAVARRFVALEAKKGWYD